MLKQHLHQLTEDLEINPQTIKEERGYLHIPINTHITLALKDLDPGIFFFSPITSLTKPYTEALFSFLMKADFLGQGTLGATIALEPNEKFLTLSLAIPYDMNYREFKETAEDFTNMIDYWREEIIRLKDQSSKSGIL